jgi:hypothetical protein
MNLLGNELVKKYFGQGCPHRAGYHNDGSHCTHVACDVLTAMQAPIKKGERYLVVNNVDNEIRVLEGIWGGKDYFGPHFYELRLPDRFQWKFELPRKELHECNCEFCGSPETHVLG